jgi:hypothetical protein
MFKPDVILVINSIFDIEFSVIFPHEVPFRSGRSSQEALSKRICYRFPAICQNKEGV